MWLEVEAERYSKLLLERTRGTVP